jgi:pimeloyl-ACP methyl ester carboxylesterase
MRLTTFLAAFGFAALTLADEPKESRTPTKGIEGFWEGHYKVGPLELRLAFTIKKENGKLTGMVDRPDQGEAGIPADALSFVDGKLTLEVKKAKATFTGALNADGSTLTGEWKGAVPYPAELKRVEKLTVLRRPQNPQRPFPYDEEEVAIDNAKASVRLGGTLTKPKGAGTFPAALLLTGSGQQDRDETIFGHKPFLVIADHLTRKGIAVLRCDDRGIGKSTGEFKGSTTADFATDAAACVAYLKSRRDIDAKHIGLIGHSEGAMIGQMLAAESDDIAFLVMLAGPGISGEEVAFAQSEAIGKALGADKDDLAWHRETQEKLFALAKAGADAERLVAAFNDRVAKLPEEKRKKFKPTLALMERAAKQLADPWLQFFLSYDPKRVLRKVRCPVLALNGSKDLQVAPKENLAAIEKALKDGDNRDVTIKEFPSLNHLFQTATTGAPSEYGKIEETFNPAALDYLTDWIVRRVGTAP